MRMTVFQYVAALCLVTAFPGSAFACGWWGDGEMNRDENAIDVGIDGVSSIPVGVQAAKIPGEKGYGIAVFQSNRAVPYLRATDGRQIAGIEQLRKVGFVTVIDLGTPAATARRHKAETELLGMHYVNIPVAGIPTEEKVELFSRTVSDSANRPVVVYGPKISLLGDMWVLHRLGQGALRGTALGEGLVFGVSRNLEETLAVQ